jgi:hypothetical protein
MCDSSVPLSRHQYLKIDHKHSLLHPVQFIIHKSYYAVTEKGKGKAIPLEAWTGPEGSRRFRLPDF